MSFFLKKRGSHYGRTLLIKKYQKYNQKMRLFQNNATTHHPDSSGLWNYTTWYYMNLSHNSKLPFTFNLSCNTLLYNYATAHCIVRSDVPMAVILILLLSGMQCCTTSQKTILIITITLPLRILHQYKSTMCTSWKLIFHPTKLFSYDGFSFHRRTIRCPLIQIIRGLYSTWLTILSLLVCFYFASNLADSVS